MKLPLTTDQAAAVTLALELLREPHHRATLLRLAMGRPMSPTRWRATSRTGEALGQGLSDLKQKKLPCQLFNSPVVPQWRGHEGGNLRTHGTTHL
jgi:hypothetical protein